MEILASPYQQETTISERKGFGTPIAVNQQSAKKHAAVAVAEVGCSVSPSPRRQLDLMLQDVTGLSQHVNGGFEFSKLARNTKPVAVSEDHCASSMHHAMTAHPSTVSPRSFAVSAVTMLSVIGVVAGSVLLLVGLLMRFEVL